MTPRQPRRPAGPLALALLLCTLALSPAAAADASQTPGGPARPATDRTAAPPAPPSAACARLSDCTPRIGLVSAFGAEADLLRARLHQARDWRVAGRRYTTGVLEGHHVVLVLSGVSIVNAALTTQLLLDHFQVERLVMSGIAGGVDPDLHVGDVTVPERWAHAMELYWSRDDTPPAPCGAPGDLACLGLRLAQPDGQPVPPLPLQPPGTPGAAATGMFLRSTQAVSPAAPQGEFRFDFEVDAAMLAVARGLQPALQRCGPGARQPDGTLDETRCVRHPPRWVVGGRGLSAPVFLAQPQVRRHLARHLQARSFDMETAALAQVAHANGVPYIAFRSLSDLAGAEAFDTDVAALFSSGLAETNEAEGTLAFLRAWRDPRTAARTPPP